MPAASTSSTTVPGGLSVVAKPTSWTSGSRPPAPTSTNHGAADAAALEGQEQLDLAGGKDPPATRTVEVCLGDDVHDAAETLRDVEARERVRPGVAPRLSDHFLRRHVAFRSPVGP